MTSNDPEHCMCQAGFGREACPLHSDDGIQARLDYDQRVALNYDGEIGTLGFDEGGDVAWEDE